MSTVPIPWYIKFPISVWKPRGWNLEMALKCPRDRDLYRKIENSRFSTKWWGVSQKMGTKTLCPRFSSSKSHWYDTWHVTTPARLSSVTGLTAVVSWHICRYHRLGKNSRNSVGVGCYQYVAVSTAYCTNHAKSNRAALLTRASSLGWTSAGLWHIQGVWNT